MDIEKVASADVEVGPLQAVDEQEGAKRLKRGDDGSGEAHNVVGTFQSDVRADGSEKRERPADDAGGAGRSNKRLAVDLLNLDMDEDDEDDDDDEEEDDDEAERIDREEATQVMMAEESSSDAQVEGIMRNQPMHKAVLVSVGTLVLPSIQLGGTTAIGRAVLNAEHHPEYKDLAKQVSRIHCVVQREGSVWTVADKSSNGLFINGIPTPVQQLYRSEGGRVKLAHGDTLILLGVRNNSGDVDLNQRPIVAFTFLLIGPGEVPPASLPPYIPTPTPAPRTPVHAASGASPASTQKRVTFSPLLGSPQHDRPAQQRPVPRRRRPAAAAGSSRPVFAAPAAPRRSRASHIGGSVLRGAIVTLGVVQTVAPIIIAVYLVYQLYLSL